MRREVIKKSKGFRTKDGAGVSLVRVLGNNTVEDYDPFLMLDSFDSYDPNDYIAGFPQHPHRGIETISYIYKGEMVHKDSLGNEDAITDGEVQWMTAGSGILHSESLPASERMLGVQLWINLSQKDKMVQPEYNSIKKEDIEEIDIEEGKIRLLAGKYKDHQGYKAKYQPLDYYDIHLNPNAEFGIETDEDDSIVLFTLVGEIEVEGEHIEEKTAVKLSKGDKLIIKNKDKNAQVLFLASRELKEPVAWGGPIVMNTRDELRQAFEELEDGSFIKDKIDY